MSTNPETVVQRQLAAYNAHDIEAYMATFSSDVELFELPGSAPTLSGELAVRVYYADRFSQNPHLRGEVTERMIFGNVVIYREVLHGLQNSESVEIVAIYQVEDDLIRRIWFMR
jgi:hypothetical protein